jgi:transcriptional regulator of acetoin/glycerol metabolism
MEKEALENVIERRVKPIVEEAMHKYLGVHVSEIEDDVSDRIRKGPMIDLLADTSIPFKKAKVFFKKRYLMGILQAYLGNVSLASQTSGLARESFHRLLKQLKINPDDFRKKAPDVEYVRETAVKNIIEKTLETYKSALNPDKFENMYKQAPALSREIVRELPEMHLTLAEAEREFEKVYLLKALDESKWNISAAARAVGLRFESLHRKMKALGIKRQ